MGLHETSRGQITTRDALESLLKRSLGDFRASAVISNLPDGPVVVRDLTRSGAQDVAEMRELLPQRLAEEQAYANQTSITVVVIDPRSKWYWVMQPNKQQTSPHTSAEFQKPSQDPDWGLMLMPLDRSKSPGSPQRAQSSSESLKKPII
jgi:hypothetical protein